MTVIMTVNGTVLERKLFGHARNFPKGRRPKARESSGTHRTSTSSGYRFSGSVRQNRLAYTLFLVSFSEIEVSLLSPGQFHWNSTVNSLCVHLD